MLHNHDYVDAAGDKDDVKDKDEEKDRDNFEDEDAGEDEGLTTVVSVVAACAGGGWGGCTHTALCHTYPSNSGYDF